MKTLIIIPAYNESDCIVDVVENITQASENVDYIVINDCSTDDTLERLQKNNINHIDLKINLGIGGGVQTGYRYAYENNYDIAIQIDGDGQHNPNYIQQLIEPIVDEGVHMVIGSRFLEKKGFQSSFMRRCGINWLSYMIKILANKKIYDVTSGYRAVDKTLIKVFKDDYAQDYPEPEAIIKACSLGYTIKEVPVMMEERQGGESSIRAFKTIDYMIKVTLALILCRFKEQS